MISDSDSTSEEGETGPDDSARNADISVPSSPEQKLQIACKYGDLDNVMKLIEEGADINYKEDKTALHLATKGGHVEIVRILLKNGADVNAVTNNGKAALHFASESGNIELVRFLIQQCKANVKAMTNDKSTPLHFAAREGHIEIVRKLITYGANVNDQTVNGETALHLSSQSGNLDVVDVLLKNKTIVDAITKNGETPLHVASRNGNVDIFRKLLINGANINATTNDGKTPLYVASKNNKVEIVRILTESNADINKADKDGETALHIALDRCNDDIARILLSHNPDINLTDNDGITPLHIACVNDNTSIVRLILEKNADVNAATKDGQTPLFLAVNEGNTDIVRTLLNYNAVVNSLNPDGATPLLSAVKEGYTDIVRILLHHNADINTINLEGLTPLLSAVKEGHIDIVRILLQHKADVNAMTPMHGTALHLAVVSHERGIVEELVLAGIDIEIRNENGKTAFELAVEHKDEEIQKLLKQKANFFKIQRFKACGLTHMARNIYVIGNCLILKDKHDNIDRKQLIDTIESTMSRAGYYVTCLEYEKHAIKSVMKEVHNKQKFGEVYCCIILSEETKRFYKSLSHKITEPNLTVYFILNSQKITLKPTSSAERSAWFFFRSLPTLLNSFEFIAKQLALFSDISLYELENFIGSQHDTDFTVDDNCKSVSLTSIEYGSKQCSMDHDEEDVRRKIEYNLQATTGKLRLFQQVNTASYRWYARIPEECDIERCTKGVFQCLISTGQSKPPRLILSVSADKLPTSQLHKELQIICWQTDSWLLTDGHSFGVSGLLKKNESSYKTSVIGITSWQSYYDMQFDGSTENSIFIANCLEDPLSKYFLHPNHTHFIFYDEMRNTMLRRESLLNRRRSLLEYEPAAANGGALNSTSGNNNNNKPKHHQITATDKQKKSDNNKTAAQKQQQQLVKQSSRSKIKSTTKTVEPTTTTESKEPSMMRKKKDLKKSSSVSFDEQTITSLQSDLELLEQQGRNNSWETRRSSCQNTNTIAFDEKRHNVEMALLGELRSLQERDASIAVQNTVFLKIVHGSKSSAAVKLMKLWPDIPVVIVVDSEESKQEALHLQNTADKQIIHTCTAENIGIIAEFYLSMNPNDIKNIRKDCAKFKEYRNLFIALIEGNMEKLEAVDWNFAIKTKGQISRLITVALKSRLAVKFVEKFYEQGYSVSDFLDEETIKVLYSIHFKEKNRIGGFVGSSPKLKKLKKIGAKLKKYSGNNLVNIYDFKKNKERLPQDVNGERMYTEFDLFLWALMKLQFDLAKVFWRFSQNQVTLAILAVGIIKSRLTEFIENEAEQTFADILSKEKNKFEKMATVLVDQCTVHNELLNGTIPVCNDHTVLYLAAEYACGNFLISPACSMAIDKLWDMKPPATLQVTKHQLPNFGKHFKKNGVAPHSEQTTEKRMSTCCVFPCVCDFSATIKFWSIFVSHILFFILMSVIALFFFRVEHIHILEIIALIWIVDLMVIESTQIKQSCDLYGMLGGLRNYLYSHWNIIDFLNLIIFLFAAVVRIVFNIISLRKTNADLESNFLIARIPLTVGIFLVAIRTIQFFDAIKKLSVTSHIAFSMFTQNVYRIGVIYLCFLLGFGVLVGALKYPFDIDAEKKFRMVLHYTFWQLVGDPSLDAFESEPPSDNSNLYNYVYHKGSTYVVLLSAGIFLLTTNILFLNLLIAMFGNTYAEIEISSKRIWAIQRFKLYYEIEKRPPLPSPFSLLSMAFSECLKSNQKRKCYSLAIEHSKEDSESLADYFRKGEHIIDLKSLIEYPDNFRDDLNDKRNVTVSTMKQALKEIHTKIDSDSATINKLSEDIKEVNNTLMLINKKINRREESRHSTRRKRKEQK